MPGLAVLVADTTVTLNGSGFNPDEVVTLSTMTYKPDDGTQGRNFGPGGIIGVADAAGQFSIGFGRAFVIGKCHTPGTVTAQAFQGSATGTGRAT